MTPVERLVSQVERLLKVCEDNQRELLRLAKVVTDQEERLARLQKQVTDRMWDGL